MDCQQCIQHQDDYLDNQLPHDLYDAMTTHIADCQDCGAMMRRNRELLQGLRDLQSPPPSPGFMKLAMANAVQVEEQRLWKTRWLQWAAVAAMVCLVVLGSVKILPITKDTTQSSGIVLSLHETKDVTLLVQSAKALNGAVITIELPPQLMLANNPDLREFSWTADFKEGRNLIPLPLVATVVGTVHVTARIEHEDEMKTMRMQVNIVSDVQG